jgi:hypothetical protein
VWFTIEGNVAREELERNVGRVIEGENVRSRADSPQPFMKSGERRTGRNDPVQGCGRLFM